MVNWCFFLELGTPIMFCKVRLHVLAPPIFLTSTILLLKSMFGNDK